MTTQEQFLGSIPASFDDGQRRPAFRRMSPLHEAAMRIADLGFGKSRSRTRDLVNLLLSHGARTWRASQPQCDLRLRVVAPEGGPAVRLKLRVR